MLWRISTTCLIVEAYEIDAMCFARIYKQNALPSTGKTII